MSARIVIGNTLEIRAYLPPADSKYWQRRCRFTCRKYLRAARLFRKSQRRFVRFVAQAAQDCDVKVLGASIG